MLDLTVEGCAAPSSIFWTPKEDTRLMELWNAGKSNAVIAAVMGVSIGAIAGRRFRLKLTPRVTHGKIAALKRWEGHRKPSNKTKATIAPKPQIAAVAPPMQPVGLMDRTGCAYPVVYTTQHLFCNNPCRDDDTAYCSHHALDMVAK